CELTTHGIKIWAIHRFYTVEGEGKTTYFHRVARRHSHISFNFMVCHHGYPSDHEGNTKVCEHHPVVAACYTAATVPYTLPDPRYFAIPIVQMPHYDVHHHHES